MSEVWLLPTAVLAALETALNRALALDPETAERLAGLEGRVIAIELRGLEQTLYLLPLADGVRLFGEYEGEPDTVLSGTPFALARMGAGPTGTGLFSGEVTLRGDTELGQRVKAILGGLAIDWEEHLSRYTGDILAHQAGNLFRGLRDWGRQARADLERDAVDYVQEERRLLPTRAEVDAFAEDVATARDDVERLEARIKHLERGGD
ncbi:MAG TPA: SCP2 sterol-binding domain-containing protein [Gammaproteobacteria bacterium]|nr:SCP2 sterol-binding domain-containing protein [Gammaproteobacteria bacterium]